MASENARARTTKRLDALTHQGAGPIVAQDLAVVVAHPDDETIGCGARLARWAGVLLVVVTDGAPRNLADARHHGFRRARDYARARRRELVGALAAAGVPRRALAILGLPDQGAAEQMAALARRLAAFIAARRITSVITHAYEGGHPDHDATALAVHAAAALCARAGDQVGIIEMPYYRADEADGTATLRQCFRPAAGCREAIVTLGLAEQALKRRMIAAHATQQAVLAPFSIGSERFRPAPQYDFTALPNAGRLLYEHYDWGMTGARFQKLAQAARRELGLT